MTSPPGPRSFRTFVVLWLSQSVSTMGTMLTFFALPTVFGAPLAGAWADRHDRRRTMLAMNLVAGVLTLTLIALMVSHRLALPLLLALMTLYCLAGAFHAACFDTSYAMLVPTEHLPRANGMMQSMWALSGVLAP